MNRPETYLETVLRYRILRHEELPEEHKAIQRAHGIDPDNMWSLIWSFETLEAAENCLKDCTANAPKFWTYKLVDSGKARESWERAVW